MEEPNNDRSRSRIRVFAIALVAMLLTLGLSASVAMAGVPAGKAAVPAQVNVAAQDNGTGQADGGVVLPVQSDVGASPSLTCTIVFTGALQAGDPTLATRMFRDDPPSTCAAPLTCPGPSGTGPYYYDTYTFTNNGGASTCVNINLDPLTCTGTPFIHASAYLGTFDPSNVCTNYLGDIGASPTAPKDFSVTVPAGGLVTLVVNSVTAGSGGACPGYVVTVSGDICPNVTPTPAPPTATNTPPPPTATNTAVPPTATETAAPSATPTACTLEFTDVPPTNTFYPFVRCLACKGIINGYACGGTGEPCDPNNNPYFRPNNPVTRGQISKIISLSAGFNEPVPPTQQSFEDVPYGTPFWEYVERLYSRGIVGGYQCGINPAEPCIPPANRPYFRPNAGATRGQLVKIASESAGFSDTIPPTQYTFTDVEPGSTFWLYIERLLANRPGAINGYPCGGPNEPCDSQNRPYFRPNNGVTRGQASKIVANTFFPGCNPPLRK